MADSAATTNNNSNNNSDPDRGKIAITVVKFSGICIAVITLFALFGAIVPLFRHDGDGARGFHDGLTMVFNALLPLFGTWVGTVMAYYFSKDNFETAARNTQTLMGLDQKLKSIKISDAWIPYDQIIGIHLDGTKTTEATVTIAQMQALLSDKVTRIAVFSPTKGILYLLHESALYKYGFEAKADVTTKTLADLLADPKMKTVATTFAVDAFNADATLADAKAAMDKVDGAQDVFLTSHGKNDEPVLGWITNVIIADKSKV